MSFSSTGGAESAPQSLSWIWGSTSRRRRVKTKKEKRTGKWRKAQEKKTPWNKFLDTALVLPAVVRPWTASSWDRRADGVGRCQLVTGGDLDCTETTLGLRDPRSLDLQRTTYPRLITLHWSYLSGLSTKPPYHYYTRCTELHCVHKVYKLLTSNFFQEFPHQKALKSVNFWQSYWKNKKRAVFVDTV